MEYAFREIENKWQAYWQKNQVYQVKEDDAKPKYYVLDMFPYPSGAGLHVGHPLGYIASDIYSRYKRLQGFNVLHPMGYDAYGLPAEQYAIQTGQHPAITTENNIKRYREQMDKLGFCYDWSREVRTCDADYYKWTQWAFIRMFNSYYSLTPQPPLQERGGVSLTPQPPLQKRGGASLPPTQSERGGARPISELISIFERQGTKGLDVACTEELSFTADEWNVKSEKEKQETLMNYRIAYLADMMVNWCPALGTVLANDEVSDGLSVRGGYPVEQKLMRQWSLRVSAYAQRLLDGLETIDWTESLKETQRNWIGRSEGAEMIFHLTPNPSPKEREKYWTTNRIDWRTNIDNAKKMRKRPTNAEDFLWQNLRNRNIDGLKFRRQHLIDQFIVDFVCIDKKLIIEVDGEYHNDEQQKQYDKQRELVLNELGFNIIRFTNDEVLLNIERIIEQIKSITSPLFRRGAEGEETSPLLGRGVGGEVRVFTTRPDTIYGATFMVLAPESEYVDILTTPEQKAEVDAYLESVKRRTERERIADRRITGVFSGSYTINPFSGAALPVWIADYVLAGYGTGAIMAVPAHDSRDYAFAKHFDLPIIPLIEGCDVSEESYDAKEGIMMNSGILNGLTVPEAIQRAKDYITENNIGRVKVNYRLRDAIFSRQRYWGEPFPVYYDKDGMPQALPEDKLPLELPEVAKFLPTETGEPPLGHATRWAWDTENEQVTNISEIDHQTVFPLELCTMPGFAGSSAYYLRYQDPHNDSALVSAEANGYWRNVDLYIGGTEHATGHLIYSRFWNKFLYDTGIVHDEEPFKKLINQGMIQGRSNFVYRIQNTNTFVSYNLKDQYEVTPLHVDVNIVSNDVLDLDAFRSWNPEYRTAGFILEDGKYICGWAVEKMSKSMYNVVNPDMIVEKFGADTLRLYEMFLGPLEQSKPWDTNGIDGVHRFLKKLWVLFYGQKDTLQVTDEEPTAAELKSLHKLIRKITYDIEHFSFNTSVSAFMICVNELGSLKCSKHNILQPIAILLAPFAPHIAEELWHLLGNDTTVCDATWPVHNEAYLVEDVVTYVVSFNGKARFNIELPAGISREEAETKALSHPNSAKWMEGKTPKKVIVVPGKIVNIVI